MVRKCSGMERSLMEGVIETKSRSCKTITMHYQNTFQCKKTVWDL
jgi:hypothetical protein